MAKKGLRFYYADTDRFQDLKIKRLKKEFKRDGYCVYAYILNEIYRVEGCFLAWDESTAFDVADYWDLKETTVNEIVNYCCAVGLFDKELLTSERVLTSRSIQTRFKDFCKITKRAVDIPSRIGYPDKGTKTPEFYVETPYKTGETPDKNALKESKVKQSKLKESSSSDEEEPKKATAPSLPSPPLAPQNVKSQKKEKEIAPPAPPPGESWQDRPVEELASEFAQNQAWQESICLSGVGCSSLQDVQRALAEFTVHCASIGQRVKTRRDYLSHFNNWLRKKQQTKQDEATRAAKGGSKTSRAMDALQQAKESLRTQNRQNHADE